MSTSRDNRAGSRLPAHLGVLELRPGERPMMALVVGGISRSVIGPVPI